MMNTWSGPNSIQEHAGLSSLRIRVIEVEVLVNDDWALLVASGLSRVAGFRMAIGCHRSTSFHTDA